MKSISFVFIWLFLIGTSYADEAYNFDDLLESTETYKSSDINKFRENLELLEKNKDQFSLPQITYFIYLKGLNSLLFGNHIDAEKYFLNVIDSTQNDDLKYKSLLSLINTYALTQNWIDGLKYLDEALLELNQITNNDIREKTILTAAVLYNQIGEFKLGLEYANRILETNNKGRSHCVASTLRAESLYNTSSNPELDDLVQNNIKSCEQNKELIWSNLNRSYIAHVLLKKNEFDGLLNILLPNLHEVESTNYSVLISEFYALLADAYFKLNDLDNSRIYSEKAISISASNTSSKPIVTAYKLLSEIASKNGDYKKALEYQEKFSNLNSSYLDDVKTKNLAYQIAKHETIEKTSRIEILNKQNDLLKLERKLAKKDAFNKQLMIALLVVIITFLAYWSYRTKKTHIRLRQLAEFDSLTGVANRRHFAQLAENTIKFTKNSEQPVSFILFDLDKFKLINDTYGHPVGDWVLKNIPKPINKIIRKVDVFGRFGGEEFSILLPGCDLKKAKQIAEEIRESLIAINTASSGHKFTISASFGVTDNKISGYHLETMMKHSDEVLYKAKRNGRNRVEVPSFNETN